MSNPALDAGVRPVDLRTRDARGDVACSEPKPALSWRLAADRGDVRQRGYEIEVAATADFVSPISSGVVETHSPIAAAWLRLSSRFRIARAIAALSFTGTRRPV